VPNGIHARHARESAVETAQLLWGLLFSSIGLGFFIYGKKQRAVVPLFCGLILMIYPYFVSNTIALVAIGAALVALPYFVRL
jgi:hypothetical protein